MKFGQQLRQSLIRDWYYYYICYDDLKAALKKPYELQPASQDSSPKRRSWTEEDEKSFVSQLEAELDKVFAFQRVKSAEIVRRIKSSEGEVNDVVSRLDQANHAGEDGVPYADEPAEADFLLLEEDLSDIIADVHDLAKFTQLNYTGFQKIIKKHDKQTSWHLKPVFATRLKAKPFFQDNYDSDIVKLSRLYDLVRTKGHPIAGDSAAGGGQQNFVRQTTKYWVHPDNITELKLIILKNLPVLVFNPNKEFEIKDFAISSIYYDNTDTWELYTGRLKKTEGAEAIRLRWYGGMENGTIFVERKTHREDWTGEKSVKARFSLKEKNVNAFLAGKMTVESIFEKARKDGKKSDKEIDDLEQLAREIQYRVITRELVPVTRSFYNRTAFQLPGDARVRISLDTELTMVREDNLDGRKRAGANWRRTDIGIDYPFSQLPAEDVERFPYAVLEVKLQTQAGQEPPAWVRELVGSHLVEAVPKFSKFIHGTAILFPTRINLLPFWMPQMDIDIRKPAARRFGIERPAHPTNKSTSEDFRDSEDELSDDEDEVVDDRPRSFERAAGHDDGAALLQEAQERMEAANHMRERGLDDQDPNELDEEERMADLPIIYHGDHPLYDSDDDNEDRLEEAKRAPDLTCGQELLKHHIAQIGTYIAKAFNLITPKPMPLPDTAGAMSALPAQVEPKRFKAPRGKRIHVPVRVEPKVYFAVERTFLDWLQISILFSGIAGVLLNFGDDVSLSASLLFLVVAVASLLYSLVVYLVRVSWIRSRRAARYYDRYGPTVLCALLGVAVAVNFGQRIAVTGW